MEINRGLSPIISAKVPLNASVAALFQAPRSTTLMKEFLIQTPKTFAVATQAGRYASVGSAAYTIDEKFTEVVNSIKFY